MAYIGCGKSPWSKIKSEITRSINGYSYCLIVFTYYTKHYLSDCAISLSKISSICLYEWQTCSYHWVSSRG